MINRRFTKIILIIIFITISLIPYSFTKKIPFYLKHSFLSYNNNFKPGIELYSYKSEINAFFSGKIISYKESIIDKNRNELIVKNEELLYKITNVIISEEVLKSRIIEKDKTVLILQNRNFEFYIKKGSNYLNPIEYFNFKIISRPYLVRIHYIKDGEAKYFRRNYKGNFLFIGVYTYTRLNIGGTLIKDSISKIKVLIDNEVVYEKNLKQYVDSYYNLLNKLYLENQILKIPPIFVNEGKHLITIYSYDSNGTRTTYKRNFNITGD